MTYCPPLSIDVSESLAVILKRTGLKQAEVARRMGLDFSVIARWASGTRPVPVVRIPALAEAIGIPILELAPTFDPEAPRVTIVRALVLEYVPESEPEPAPPPVQREGPLTLQAGNFCGPHRYWHSSPVPGRPFARKEHW